MHIAAEVCVATKLSTDRAWITKHVLADLSQRPSALAQPLNLIACLSAQVRVAHVQFHLAVKLYRLPRLRLFTSSGVALQN